MFPILTFRLYGTNHIFQARHVILDDVRNIHPNPRGNFMQQFFVIPFHSHAMPILQDFVISPCLQHPIIVAQ